MRSPSLVEMQRGERGCGAFSSVMSCTVHMCQCGEWSFLLTPCLNQGRSFCVPVPQELKGLFPLHKKVFGEKKRGRENECMIPASWNFPYSDSFVALDSGPWLSAHQLHLPKMQTGVFCGFWFYWVCSLVGCFCFVWLDFFRKTFSSVPSKNTVMFACNLIQQCVSWHDKKVNLQSA